MDHLEACRSGKTILQVDGDIVSLPFVNPVQRL
jgi:hypothetical protein